MTFLLLRWEPCIISDVVLLFWFCWYRWLQREFFDDTVGPAVVKKVQHFLC